MAFGITQSDGSNITGFSGAVQPDKGLGRQTTMRVHLASFGDGYEQRIADGINIEDSNESSSTETIFCICDTWQQSWAYENFYTLTATFRRVYES